MSGKVVGNDVEANIHSLRFESCSNILAIRNKLFSSNLRYKDNVLIKESQDIEFKNNLVQKGFSALKVQNSALISIANNIFMDAQNFGVFMQNVFNSTFVNNAVFNNNVGVMVFTSPQANFSNADIKYNFFRNHIYGNTVFDDNSENLDASNIVQSYSNEEWETQNPLFERLDIFNLRNRSILVDSGSDMAIYNDGFNFNQQIAKGTARNDIGLYGGPYAGRVGVGQTILFSPNDENIQLAIEQSFPGDFLFFAEGSYDIDAAIEVYPYQVFQGTTLGKTIFNQLHDGVLFSIAKRENANYKLEEIQIENLNIRSNGGTAFNITESQGASAESISIKKTVIKDAEVGVFVKNAKDILLQYNTFISTDYPVYVEDQFEPSVQFTHNIVNEAITGVVNLSLLTVTSSYSIFNDVQTNYSGEVVEQDNQFVFNADIFWNSLNEQYMLRPGSLGIDMDGLIDAGAYEYYVSEGIFTFPYFSSNLNRQYKSVSVNFIQTSSHESFLSTIELSVNAYSQRLTLNQKIEISQNIVTNNIILFPSNIISNSAQFKFYIRSYIFNQSPAVEKITVTW